MEEVVFVVIADSLIGNIPCNALQDSARGTIVVLRRSFIVEFQ